MQSALGSFDRASLTIRSRPAGLLARTKRKCVAIFLLLHAFCPAGLCGEFEQGRAALELADYRTAFAHFAHAAETGHPGAQYNLATMYHEGQGVERNPTLAAFWYAKAAERGNTASQYWLCIMHREGIGVPRDYAEAFYWCHRAAEKGHAAALFALGQFYFDGLGNGFTRDHVRAYMWFSLADAQGDQDARLMLESLENDMTPRQVAEARRLAKQWAPGGQLPCTSNNPRARFC